MNEQLRNKLIDYITKLNTNEILSIVSAINSYNGSLEDYNWYFNYDYEFDDILSGCKPSSVARYISNGNYSSYDTYFRFDGNGNLESTNFLEFDSIDIEEIVDAIEYVDIDYLPDEIADIIRKYDDDNDDDDFEVVNEYE